MAESLDHAIDVTAGARVELAVIERHVHLRIVETDDKPGLLELEHESEHARGHINRMTDRVSANADARRATDLLQTTQACRLAGEEGVGIAGFGRANVNKFINVIIAAG